VEFLDGTAYADVDFDPNPTIDTNALYCMIERTRAEITTVDEIHNTKKKELQILMKSSVRTDDALRSAHTMDPLYYLAMDQRTRTHGKSEPEYCNLYRHYKLLLRNDMVIYTYAMLFDEPRLLRVWARENWGLLSSMPQADVEQLLLDALLINCKNLVQHGFPNCGDNILNRMLYDPVFVVRNMMSPARFRYLRHSDAFKYVIRSLPFDNYNNETIVTLLVRVLIGIIVHSRTALREATTAASSSSCCDILPTCRGATPAHIMTLQAVYLSIHPSNAEHFVHWITEEVMVHRVIPMLHNMGTVDSSVAFHMDDRDGYVSTLKNSIGLLMKKCMSEADVFCQEATTAPAPAAAASV
jgi:hypothetical protein